jgi:DNA adenine methylase
MKPFLKWPGGKRWLTSKYAHLFPRKFKTYIEPFLGSGSVFFHLAPNKALLGDTNQELIATYSGLRHDPMVVEDALLMHELNHCEAYYYSVRDSRLSGLLDQFGVSWRVHLVFLAAGFF